MKKLVWHESYTVGVAQIDKQHRDFIRLVNGLSMVSEFGSPRDWTLRILLELTKYAEYHFTSEENLMMLANCPLLARQQEEHARLLQTLAGKIKAYETGRQPVARLQAFLGEWFMTHVLEEDKAIGRHLNV